MGCVSDNIHLLVGIDVNIYYILPAKKVGRTAPQIEDYIFFVICF